MDDGSKFSDLSPQEQERIAAAFRRKTASTPVTGDAVPVMPSGFAPESRPKEFGYGDRHPNKSS